MMENMLLRVQEIVPLADVLKEVLGDVYPSYESFINSVTGDAFGLTYEWRYYNDGKSWLCKVCNKKKTICWLSVWEGYFQLSFYFTEKHLEAIDALDIAEAVKEDFMHQKPVGKLLPMLFRIKSIEQLPDVLKVVEFKKKLK